MQDEQHINAYYKGLLNEAQLAVFNERVASDTNFAKAVNDYDDMQASIAENERIQLKKRFQELEEKGIKTPSTINYGRWSMIASVFIIFGISYVIFFQSNFNSQDSYFAYYEPYPNVLQPVTRGADDDNVTTFSAYEAGNYKKAITGFSEMLYTSENADVRFYYAMSLLNDGQAQKSLTQLKHLENSDTKFVPQVYWYSALIHLKNGQTVEAKDNIEKLQQLKVSFKADEAAKLLDTLD